MPRTAPKAAGCVVTSDDFSRVCVSLSCFFSELGCGAVTATLGMAIPHLSAEFGVPCADLGIILTLSGLGYFMGVSLSSSVMDVHSSWHLNAPIFWLVCFSAIVSGLSCFALLVVHNLLVIKAIVFLQFMGMAGIDCLGTVALAEMWGQRVQPWMQTRSAFYAVGGIVPPLVGAGGIAAPWIVSGLFCFSGIFGGLFDIIYRTLFEAKLLHEGISESTPLVPRERSRSRRSSSTPSSSGMSPFIAEGAIASRFESEELSLLERIIEADNDDTPFPTPKLVQSIGDIVTTVLDATPYCNITEEQRNDPIFEPNINKTLSYATQPIVDTVLNQNDVVLLEPPKPNFLEAIKQSVDLVPPLSKFFLAVLTFLYCSIMTSIVGWFPTYFLLNDFEGDEWTGMGAHIVSVYFVSMSIGCFASIPCSVWISITKLLRFHLSLIAIGGVMLQLAVLLGSQPMKSLLLCGACFMGYGISAIFPLAVTVVNDYGFTMDASVTSGMLRGVSMGAIVVPIVLGYFMREVGPDILTLCLFLLGLGLVLCYIVIHVTLTREAELSSRKASISVGPPFGIKIEEHPSMSAHHNAQRLIRALTVVEEETHSDLYTP